jgi:hypothetical protein
MNYLKLFEAYFDNKKDTTWEEVDTYQLREFEETHPKIIDYDYDDVFEIFDETYNLYQKDFHDFNNNQYRKMPLAIEIYLVNKKIDIFISIYQDDWYSIRVCKYRSSEDDDYYSVDNYLADGIDGVNDWIAQFN